MRTICAALRLDEFHDGYSALEAVEVLRDSGFTFLSTEKFLQFFDQSEPAAPHCIHLSVFALTNEFAAFASRRLDELNIPFLLVSDPGASDSEPNWAARLSLFVDEAASGRYQLAIGGGIVNYNLGSFRARELAKLDLFRRLSVLSEDRRIQTIRGIGVTLVCGLSDEKDIAEHETAAAAPGWPPASGIQELGSSAISAAKNSSRAAAMLFRHMYWETGSLDSTRSSPLLQYSYSGHLCEASEYRSGRLPQIRLPRDAFAVDMLKKRLEKRQSEALSHLTAMLARCGGKRAALSLAKSLIVYFTGGFRQLRRPDFNRVRRIVFFCKGNINRSAYAACLISERFGVDSASFGLSANNVDSASIEAQERAVREGFDLSRHVTTAANSFDLRSTDLIVGFEPGHVERHKSAFSSACTEHQYTLLGLWTPFPWPYIQDPIVRSELYYEQCFDLIAQGVKRLSDAFRSAHSLNGGKEL